jgi:circadian clock protein KaiC
VRIPSGVPGLDQIIGGGLPKNRLYLIRGEPGTGKTTFALQFLLEGLERGETVLYVTSPQTADELRDTALSHGWSLDKVDIYELSAANQPAGSDQGQTSFHAPEVELSETTNALMSALEESRPSRVVFDTLSDMRLLAGGALPYRRQILLIKQYLRRWDSTALLLDDDLALSKDMQGLVTGVIEMEDMTPEFGRSRRRLRVVKLRGGSYASGYHDFAIESEGIVIYPPLVADESRGEVTRGWLSTGNRDFDRMLGGGLDTGTATVIMGPAGSGKSSIAAQIVASAARLGDKAALFLFDERPPTLLARAMSLTIPLKSGVDSGLVSIRHIGPAELSPGEFAHAVRREVEQGAVIIVIDSIQGYLNAMPAEKFLILRLHELLSYLGQGGVSSVLVLGQTTQAADHFTPIDVSYLADTVIVTDLDAAEDRLKRTLSIFKRRAGQHDENLHDLRIGPVGVGIGRRRV